MMQSLWLLVLFLIFVIKIKAVDIIYSVPKPIQWYLSNNQFNWKKKNLLLLLLYSAGAYPRITRSKCNSKIRNGCAEYLQWFGKGCSSKSKKIKPDGGCQPKLYCGWQCKEKCEQYNHCEWYYSGNSPSGTFFFFCLFVSYSLIF